MNNKAGSLGLTVTQAKKVCANGDVEYYYSIPKVSLLDFKGMAWIWQRLKEYKKARKESKENITKVIYN